MRNTLGRTESYVIDKEQSALANVAPITRGRDSGLQLGKQDASSIERYQKDRPPVDIKHDYTLLKEKKTDLVVALPKVSKADGKDVIDKIMRNVPKQVAEKQKNRSILGEVQNTAVEPMDDSTTRKKSCSAYVISVDLLHSYSFGVCDNQLYVYDERFGYWKFIPGNAENRILRALISDEYKFHINKSTLSEIYEWLCVESEPLDFENSGKYYLNFKDCAVEWRTEKEISDRKELHFDYYLDLNYLDLDHYQNGEMKRFLKEVFGEDKQTKKEFSKFFGLCLSNIRTLKITGFLYGPSNTGKSVTLNLLKLLVGEQWTSSVSFSQLSNEFAITRLLGKRLNVTGEVSGTSNRRLDIFKSLTGNDTVEICYKGKDHFPFKSKCMLVFACNSFPQIQDIPEFESFLSRLVIFPFNNQKDRSEWTEHMEKELLGDAKEVIRFAMEGLRRLEQDHYQIIPTKAMEVCKDEFVDIYDSFSVFADMYLEVAPGNKVATKEIADSYKRFCNAESYRALDVNIWGQILKQKFSCRQCTVKKDDEWNSKGTAKKRVRGYEGIRLKRTDEIEN